MLYTICIGLILVACVLMVLAVLVQSPKSGMAANFGASNQVMGVRQTTDFLEKFTWAMAITILALSLLATVVMKGTSSNGASSIDSAADALMQARPATEMPMPQAVDGAESVDVAPVAE
ncbi:MAG: preprotein translocase subunit SecG [Rikenellaceae bacterium]